MQADMDAGRQADAHTDAAHVSRQASGRADIRTGIRVPVHIYGRASGIHTAHEHIQAHIARTRIHACRHPDALHGHTPVRTRTYPHTGMRTCTRTHTRDKTSTKKHLGIGTYSILFPGCFSCHFAVDFRGSFLHVPHDTPSPSSARPATLPGPDFRQSPESPIIG